MKAIRVQRDGRARGLRLEEVPDPTPGAGQVVVRIHAAGVNPVDVYIRSAAQGRQPALPYMPGIDGAGVVEALGPGVSGLAVGDRVYLSGTATGAAQRGTYAERALCLPAHVHPLPADVSFGQGAAVNVPYATAYRALFDRAQAQPGETVLVHGGSGGVGIAAIQIARAAGMTVFATAGTTARQGACPRAGRPLRVRSHGAGLSGRRHRAATGRPRRRRHPRDARQREPRQGPRPARALRAAWSSSATAAAWRSMRGRRWDATRRSWG